MNLVVILASALFLQPVLVEDATIRLAASDTHGESVEWYIDGVYAATTSSNATNVWLSAGEHLVWATTTYEGSWQALVRPDTATAPGNVAFVRGWTANHAPESNAFNGWSVGLGLVGAGIIAYGLRPKRP